MINGLEYLDHIRSLDCCVMMDCLGNTVPHHLSTVGMGRDRKKPMLENYWTIPICVKHHDEIHHSLEKFEKKYSINVLMVALKTLTGYLWNREVSND